MPSHYGNKKGNKKPAKNGGLPKAQQKELLDHSAHHTKAHMNMMRSEMKKGMTFQGAHEKAMKKVGK